jgi:RNA recognition motif-containing protein
MYNKYKNRGLAFVEMGSPEEALAALNALQSYVCKPNITFILFSFWSCISIFVSIFKIITHE